MLIAFAYHWVHRQSWRDPGIYYSWLYSENLSIQGLQIWLTLSQNGELNNPLSVLNQSHSITNKSFVHIPSNCHTFGVFLHIFVWSAICKIILYAKVNSICHMPIFIYVASKNVCVMPKSISNMGNFICHTLTFINFMCKFMCDMRYLICCK